MVMHIKFILLIIFLCINIGSYFYNDTIFKEETEEISNNIEIQHGEMDGVHIEAAVDDEFKTAYDKVSGIWINEDETVYLKIYEDKGVYYISQNTSDDKLVVSSLNDYDIYSIKLVDSTNESEIIDYSCNTEIMQYSGRLMVSTDKTWICIEDDIILYPYNGDINVENYINAKTIYNQMIHDFPEMENMEFLLDTCKEMTRKNVEFVYDGFSEKEVKNDAIKISLMTRISSELEDHTVIIFIDKNGKPINIDSWEID